MPKKQKLCCPQPCLPEPANTQPPGILLFHPGLPPGLTSRYASLTSVLHPQPQIPAMETPPVEGLLGCITGKCRQSPGREDFYPPRGSGLYNRPSVSSCQSLGSSGISEMGCSVLSLMLMCLLTYYLWDQKKRHSMILTMESPWWWVLVYFIFQITFCNLLKFLWSIIYN